MRRRPLATVAALALSGCLSHMPPDRDPAHLHIDWVPDYEAACSLAAKTVKPLLLVMVAGDIQERC